MSLKGWESSVSSVGSMNGFTVEIRDAGRGIYEVHS